MNVLEGKIGHEKLMKLTADAYRNSRDYDHLGEILKRWKKNPYKYNPSIYSKGDSGSDSTKYSVRMNNARKAIRNNSEIIEHIRKRVKDHGDTGI